MGLWKWISFFLYALYNAFILPPHIIRIGGLGCNIYNIHEPHFDYTEKNVKSDYI